MEDDDEFGDLYSDVLQPFQPKPTPHRSIDLNLRSQDQDAAEPELASVSRVSNNEPSKLSQDAIEDGGGDDKDMRFDIEEPDADSSPAIPGLFVSPSIPGLATDRDAPQATTGIEQVGGDGGGGGYGVGQQDDWDSDSEDDLQIVLNDNGDRRSRMGDNEDDDDDDEDPLVIVADTDPNQPMEEQLWGEDGVQGGEGDGKEGGEAGKGSGPAGPPKAGFSTHGYHPYHSSQFKVSVNATLSSLVSILSRRGSCSSLVLICINYKCICSLYLYINLNANAEYINQRNWRMLLDFDSLSLYFAASVFVPKIRMRKGDKNKICFSSLVYRNSLPRQKYTLSRSWLKSNLNN